MNPSGFIRTCGINKIGLTKKDGFKRRLHPVDKKSTITL
jgi:hypothetical protein